MSKEKKFLTTTIDYSLLIIVIIITFFGMYMVLSATFYSNIFDESSNPLLDFISDFKKIFIGLFAMIVAIYVKAKWIKKAAPLLMFISIALLILTLIIGTKINGATRWIYFGSSSFATSELAKIAAIFYFAGVFEHMTKSEKAYKRAWYNVIIFAGVSVILILVQPDYSTTIVYCLIVGAMMFVAGAKWKHLFLVLVIGGMLGTGLILAEPYRLERFAQLKSSDTDYIGDAAQANKSLLSIAEGGIFGVGPGRAYQTKNAIPQAESDFIFATIAETTGYLGSTILIGAYVFLLWRLVKISLASSSGYAALVSMGLTVMIGMQTSIHLLYTTKLFPVTGIPLPFISSGGTSTILLLASIGVVLNFSSNPEGI